MVVTISWVLFRSSNLENALSYIKSMFVFDKTTNFEFLNFYFSTELIIVTLLAIMISVPLLRNNLYLKNLSNTLSYKFFKTICLVLIFIVCCIYVSVEAYNPFIYFRF